VEEKPASDKGDDLSLIRISTGTEYDALFSPSTGFLQKYSSKTETIDSKIKLVKYGTTQAREKSGAYLFLPDGPAVGVDPDLLAWVRVESGPLRTRVCVNMHLILHCVEIMPTVNAARGLKVPCAHVWNVVDLRKSTNYELVMLVQTKINSKDILYTDLNGLQYTKRRRHAKLTLQGNVYPMPAGAFVQDSSMRVHVLSGQPLGVASMASGELQVFLDRRLNQDDNRGMEQAMDDNVVVANRFVLLFDVINSVTSSSDKIESVAADFPSLMATWLSNDLLYPLVRLVQSGGGEEGTTALNTPLVLTNKKYPCDMHMVNMRTMQAGMSEEPVAGEVGLTLHRVTYEDCPAAPYVQLSNYIHTECDAEALSSKFKFEDMFQFMGASALERMTVRHSLLTLAKNTTLAVLKKSEYVLNHVQPMQVEAFKIKF
jgi:alpha-mannosidase II